jgi:hypothetical protein
MKLPRVERVWPAGMRTLRSDVKGRALSCLSFHLKVTA